MPTAAQLTAERKRLRREAEQAARKRDRAKLHQLREHIRNARRLRVQRAREVVIACRQARVRLREQRKVLRARYLHELAAARERQRLASRTACNAQRTKVKARGASGVQRALHALAAEREHQSKLRVFAQRDPLKRKQPKANRADALHESDSQVMHNIPHDLHPVWRSVRARIKSTPRRSRTETFLEWVQEHGGEVQRILDRQYERDVSELVAQEAELRRRVQSPRAYRRMSSTQLDDVPF
jgi:hypothetical protein